MLVWPSSRTAPLPNADLPDDITADYEEAASILEQSPRGAAALLRLAIEKLCRNLVPQDKLDKMIGELVKSGLRVDVQQALDAVRVIGNDAVHPGQMDLRDNSETAKALFRLVNYVAEQMISAPKEIQSIYESLPEKKLQGIQDRDKKTSRNRPSHEYTDQSPLPLPTDPDSFQVPSEPTDQQHESE